ncbi:hypothetical protein NPIL_41401 [Nephila pilipes]|uniref:Uncharacterized protein n=1 Tax=Nephila pilipes TaxID=299642 RepID=A0A8X6Q4V6_NEPPI|nr:hypothetical protein NPIL_41401 [Nephila pilipes]
MLRPPVSTHNFRPPQSTVDSFHSKAAPPKHQPPPQLEGGGRLQKLVSHSHSLKAPAFNLSAVFSPPFACCFRPSRSSARISPSLSPQRKRKHITGSCAGSCYQNLQKYNWQ